MRRRLIAAWLALVLIGSIVPMTAAASPRPCCCKNASGCPMHQKHDAGGCRIDRCGSGEDGVSITPTAIRAVLVSVSLPLPEPTAVAFDDVTAAPRVRAVDPIDPPPRLA